MILDLKYSALIFFTFGP